MKTLNWLWSRVNIILIGIWVAILCVVIFPILILGLIIDPNSLWRDNLADWFIEKLKQYSEYIVYYATKNPYSTDEYKKEVKDHFDDLWNE